MKLISLFIVLIFSLQSIAADLPLMIESENITRTEARKIQFPNNQITQTGTKEYRAETGNKNLLANPSFEAAIASGVIPSWSLADAGKSAETVDVIDGKQALEITMIGDPVNLYQDSTINVTGLSDGVQGLLYIKVKNNTDKTLYACPRNAGATAAISECLTIPNDNTWFTKPLHTILGGTSNGIALTSNGEFTTGTILVDGAYLGVWDIDQDTPVVSTNSNTDWQPCGHTTSDFIGFGTVTNIETQCKRDGSDLLMRGNFTSGTSTAVEARLALRFQGQSLTSADSTKIPGLQVAGVLSGTNYASTLFGWTTLIEPSVGYATFGRQSSVGSGLTKATGSTIDSSGSLKTFSLTARIPIDGWENSNVIVGSFKEVVTTPGVTKPKTYKAYFAGATNVTACAASPCTKHFESDSSFGSSLTRSATGKYQLVTGEVFSPSSYIHCSYLIAIASQLRFVTAAPVSDSSGALTLNIETYGPTGSLSDGIISLECSGATP